MFRKLWNGVLWGSAEGPEIFIDWDKRSVKMLRCPRWLAKLLLRRISYSGATQHSADEMARALLRVSKKSKMPIFLAAEIQDILEQGGFLPRIER